MKITIATLILLYFAHVQAATSCKAFVFYEGAPSPEPVQIECSKNSKTMSDCKKSCLSAAKKKCAKGIEGFNANVNFNSSTSGFEADNVSGKCKKTN